MRREHKQRRATIIVIVVAGLLVGGFLLGPLRPLRNLTDPVFNPITRSLHRAAEAVAGGARFAGSVGQLNSDNAHLRAQVADLQRQLTDLKEVRHENDELRAQLNFPQTRQYNLVPANVLGSSPDAIRTVLQIDKGTANGVQTGQAVIANGALVGTVESADRYSAKVLALNDPVFKISAIAQDSRATGIVQGQLGTGLGMDKISQTDPIKSGETVITAGSGLVPKGIIIGTVESVNRADNAIFQSADLKPAATTQKLEVVFVVQGQKS